MPIINVQINDTLQERVDDAIEQVKDQIKNYHKQNPDDGFPDISDLDYHGSIHDIVDSSVPVYTKEIEDTWYLHKSKLISAYEDAGIGSNALENDGMTAIYCYIEQEVNSWYSDEGESYWNELVSGENAEDKSLSSDEK